MDLTDKNFEEEVLRSDLPVLIEFWASWCVPCKAMDYILNELEIEFNGKVKIAKLNVDRNRLIPKKYEVTGVPTFLLFKKGILVESKVGAISKGNLVNIINKFFN